MIVEHLLTGHTLSSNEWQQLENQTFLDQRRARAFGITPDNVGEQLRARSHLLKVIYSDFSQFCQTHFHTATISLDTLWNLWLPLTLRLAKLRQVQDRPFIQGILGGQGTGKTTLGAILTLLLKHLGYQTLSLSLDDLYKTYSDRLHLRNQDPRLIWRGPPGTHDVELGIHTLDALRNPSADELISIPRFDKSLHAGAGDRTDPELVSNIDIVLFEGWFVGLRPINPAFFDAAPAPIITEGDRAFARDINTYLQAYLPLWKCMDSLMVLYPTDYRFSKQWRQQAEHEMQASGKPGMSDSEIDAFVDYFWKALHPDLFIKPLVKTVGAVDLVVEIDENHKPGAVYRSGDCSET